MNARLKKLLKRFLATPMRKSTFLLAQFLSRFVFLIVEVAVVTLFAWLVFDVSIRGPIWLFCFLSLLGGAAFAGIGILVSSRVSTLEAMSGLMNVVMMPMWICSGVFFSYERFPDAVKPIIRALPLTALADALRAVMNDGCGIRRRPAAGHQSGGVGGGELPGRTEDLPVELTPQPRAQSRGQLSTCAARSGLLLTWPLDFARG